MHTELTSLTDSQKTDLALFVKKIVKDIAIHQIVCYGIRASDTWNWSALPVQQQPQAPSRIVIDLLLVPDEKEKRPSADIQQMVEKKAIPHISCTCIVRTQRAVYQSLANRHLFYSRLYSQGVFLYGSREVGPLYALFEPATQDFLNQAAPNWEHHFSKACRFRCVANWMLEGRFPDQAMFYLHQCTEQTAMALLHALTGYKPNSHNIPHLLSLLEQLGLNIDTIFPPHEEDAQNLFALLKNSYIDSRYAGNYSIEMGPVETLYDKIELLMKMVEKCYKQQISSWQEETDGNPEPPNDGGAIAISLPDMIRQAS